MSEKVPQSVRDFLPKTPDQITLTTGAEEMEKVYEVRDSFFMQIRDYLGMPERSRLAFSQITTRGLSLEDFEKKAFFNAAEKVPLSDQYVSVLTVNDIAVASCLFLRDPFNYHQVSFAHYLTEETEQKVRRFMHNYSNEMIVYIDDPHKE